MTGWRERDAVRAPQEKPNQDPRQGRRGLEVHHLRLLLHRLLHRSRTRRRRQGGGGPWRRRCAGEPRQALHQGHLRARTVQLPQSRQDSAAAGTRHRCLPRNDVGGGARLHGRGNQAHPGTIRPRQRCRCVHRSDPDRRVLHARQARARRHRHQQLRRQYHAVHGLRGLRVQTFLRQRRPSGLLR